MKFKNATIHIFSYCLVLILISVTTGTRLYAQVPANDNCADASLIQISDNGFGLGLFTSAQTNLTNATVQSGEVFAPAIFVAGQDKKSVWYKFSIPTIRAVRVTLTQPGTTITAGDAGFAVYQSGNCLPGIPAISNQLTPIVTFGNTYHPCVPAGEYLVQVSSKLAANGPVIVNLEISDQTGAAYDHPYEAYNFGIANVYSRRIDFDPSCQSIEDENEICSVLHNYKEYHKSAWFTFTTPAYLDYMVVTLSGNGSTTYFPSSGSAVLKKFGYALYKGDVKSADYRSMPVVDGCDSLLTNGYRAAIAQYTCNDLEPNTTYSIQLFIHKDFKDMLRLGLITGGTAATAAPRPVSTMPASNKLGVLNAQPNGPTTTVFDNLGCNGRLINNACGSGAPATGVTVNNVTYTLASYVSFSLNSAAAITFLPYIPNCNAASRPIVRVFKQSLTANCSDLDEANLVGIATYNQEIECFTPGDYIIQVLGRETPVPATNYYYSTAANNYDQCLFTNLGARYRLDMRVYYRKAAGRYSLYTTGAYDTINKVAGVQQPLVSGVTYPSSPDTIGCQPTLRPWDTTCAAVNDKIHYRQFVIADSGTVAVDNMVNSNNPPLRYKLYSGDANALAAAQNVFSFPDRVTGIVPQTLCWDGATYCANKSACVVPGTYTFVTMGSVGDVGRADRPSFTFSRTRTRFNSLQNALNMGSIMDTLGPNGGTKITTRDFWSCEDNAKPINGYVPCNLSSRPATKAMYMQFYLKEDAIVRIANPGYGGWCVGNAHGLRTLFYGKATDGEAGLTPVGGQWNCFTNAQTTNNCSPLPAGWYTVVSYGTGPSYDSVMRLVNTGGKYNGHVGYFDEYNITITPACPGPKFNRPYKASVAAGNTPHLVEWKTRAISTPVYPRTDTSYTLPAESFNCTLDTPFANHPIAACAPASNRVAYYVFRTTQVCFLQINTGGYFAKVYDKDVRADSLQFITATPIQECLSNIGYIQFCHFQPGTYTLVVFASDANICNSVTPRIFIDRVDYSRFDFAANAYDFGTVPPDNTYRFGKIGDVNPLHPTRPPSSDFFYCTTGATATDPTNTACSVNINPNIYSTADNQPLYNAVSPPVSGNIARRNLWYTFVVDHPGTVRVRVENKTLQRGLQPRFAVYSSDVDAALPFNAVQAGGLVDSTVAQGLSFITMNYITYYYCYNAPNNISFYRDPCTAKPTRYYILVDNVNGISAEAGGQLPNTQIDVSVSLDSFNLVLPKFDFYSQADDLGTVAAGVHTGQQDNYSCATRSASDPLGSGQGGCTKTLWYKFTSTITGNVRYRIRIGNGVFYGANEIQLHKQVIPGDSTNKGLQLQTAANVSTPSGVWSQSCVTTGTYYLLLPGCNRVNQYVTPEIELIEQEGDFCGRAVPAAINGAGSATATVLVNCHTIGTDYGEFGPALTCPQDGVTTRYKSSWFRMDIGGTDTLDVTTYLVENTNAASSDIKYRMMTGDCSAMQEQSCVLDALTQNTYQCLVPGQSYYIQVFTPVTINNAAVTGTIDLKLSAIAHADTCAPLNNCLVNANFNTRFDCTLEDSVKFVNFSTYGSSITYKWDLGHNGQTSTAVSPSYFYPVLPNDTTYTVKLLVTNTACNQSDSVERTITVPGRPYINFGNDIIQCGSTAPVVLRATSHPGATYLWQNNSTADTFRVTATGNNNYWVRVNYNGCSRRDTVRVLISPINSRPLQQIFLCTDSVLVDVRRGNNETYRWSTGATTRSIYMSRPGIYWVDISYFDCVFRDSFEVNNINSSKPFGSDTTICFAKGSYVLHAAMPAAVSYTWQNNSTADTFRVTAAGQYRVNINFGNCIVRDTINIANYPASVSEVTDTAICFGQVLDLPWGEQVAAAGIYRDTLRYPGGCDSLIRRFNVSLLPQPNLGRDTAICPGNSTSFTLNAAMPGAVQYTWQDGSSNSTFEVTQPGQYTVQVDYSSCFVTDTIAVTLLSSPATVTMDTSICSGTTITLPWGLQVNSAGLYTDTIQSAGGCDSLIYSYNITLTPALSIGNDTAVAICSGGGINLNDYYSAPGGTWSFNNNAVANTAAVFSPGNYRFVATNAGGCTDTAFLLLTVTAPPVLGNDSAVIICPGQSVDLNTVYPVTTLTRQWILNGNPVDVQVPVTTAGQYILTATNAAGCSDTAVLDITVSTQTLLGADTSVNACGVVNLSTLYMLQGLNATWLYNGAAVANPAVINAAGTYQLAVVDADGCRDTIAATVNIYPVPVLGNDTVVSRCAGQVVNLNNLYNYTPLTAVWTINNTLVPDANAVAAAGNYRLVATNSFGCTDTAFALLSFLAKPVLGNDTAVGICTGKTVNLTALYNTSGGSATWTVNGNTVTNPAAVVAAGIYQIILSGSGGCADTALVTVSVSPNPQLIITNPATLCYPQAVDLTGTVLTQPGLIYSYWTNADATIPLNTPAAATAGTWYIKAVNADGCETTGPVTVSYYPVPVVHAGNDVVVCDGGTAILRGTVSNTTVPVTYQWQPVSTGGIESPASAVTVVNPLGTQQYILTVTDGYGCNYTISDTVLVTMQPPVPAFAGNDTLAVVGVPHQLRASGGVQYLWTPAGPLNNPGIANPMATLYDSVHIFQVRVTDAAGCEGIAAVAIRTVNGITYYVPNAFSPNGDGRNDVFRPLPVGIARTEIFRIFNRYGELLFETSQLSKGWDGTYKGKPQPVGNYVWMLRGRGVNGRVIEMKGNVVLVR
ncbi:MAG TPA: gliding motility-associated C-terminal domain-containing protein [Ferruginibacter sp.]|nr:gliding motility-associated C-terminal domain-containing protein [Ferruginibacter sp.]